MALGRARIPTPIATKAKLTTVLKLDEPFRRPMLLAVGGLLKEEDDAAFILMKI